MSLKNQLVGCVVMMVHIKCNALTEGGEKSDARRHQGVKSLMEFGENSLCATFFPNFEKNKTVQNTVYSFRLKYLEYKFWTALFFTEFGKNVAQGKW